MRIHLIAFGLTLAMLCPAWASVTIDDLLVSRVASNINIEVTLRNPGEMSQEGPVVVHLLCRPQGGQEWILLQTWTDIKVMGGGDRLSRDYFDVKSTSLARIAGDGRFQIKAVVEAPGLSRPIEKTSAYTALSAL